MKTILVIGIGAGNPEHVTVQAIKALNRADVLFMLDKGPHKQALLGLRRDICERYITGSDYRVVDATSPERDRSHADYAQAVQALNTDKQHLFEQLIAREVGDGQCGAFLVWGDPTLYDSTLRILDAILAGGRQVFDYEVIPGITSVQALTARHRVPLNDIGRAVTLTTGRLLADGPLPATDSVVVMLDAQQAFRSIDCSIHDLDIYWGAYLGTPDEILINGRLAEVAPRISEVREQARARHGWIMDTYLLKKPAPGR